MSTDPAPPSDSEPTSPKPTTEPIGDNVDPMRVKRRFKRTGGEAEEGDKPPDQAIEVLSSLLQDLVAKKEQRPAVPEQAAPLAKGAKYHRLSKTGSGNPAAPVENSPATVEASTASTTSPASAAPTTSLTPATPAAPVPPVAFRPAPTFEPEEDRRRLRRWQAFSIVCFLAVIGLGTYVAWFQRAAEERRPAPTRPAPASEWTDASLQQLDRAFAAEQAGDLKEARRLAAAIASPGTNPPPGLTIYIATLDTRTERYYDAEADLLRLSKDVSPELTAAANTALAFNFSRSRDFEKAAAASRTAILNDPFSPSRFYEDGEIARHQGHLPDAVASFRRALDRLPMTRPETESLREVVGFKLRLCSLEQGRESDFQSALDEQLRAATPSGYWLLTAAAVALQHKDLAAASGLLERARTTLGAGPFDALLNDYFFRAYADRKELADFFPDPATQRAKLLPSRALTIEP